MLEARCVTYRCKGKALVRDVSLKLETGNLVALLGPNGAGKSTLIKLLSGQLQPSSGEVLLDGAPLKDYAPEQLALRRGHLAQSRSVGFPFPVFDVVMMGRHPHSMGRGETDSDQERVEACLSDTDSLHLAHRVYNTLSGGEAARVDLARVLAQDTAALLLDEPTNHLDPKHQVSVLSLCRSLADAGHAVVVGMHDLNLAARYADHVVVMANGCLAAAGDPEATLTPDTLCSIYNIGFDIWPRPGGGICILPASADRVIKV